MESNTLIIFYWCFVFLFFIRRLLKEKYEIFMTHVFRLTYCIHPKYVDILLPYDTFF